MCDSDEENYAIFGVALEPLDEENLPRKKAITIEDQYAYDAQGRRRFHGAFTGGFSAGYFNTVGTRDGWKPQQFKSSRDSKAKAVAQQPEDFMDEEDVSIFGIAPKGIRANSDYEYHGQKGTKRNRAEAMSNKSLSCNPVLKELLRPARETVGIALLKKMGWRPGQGIGNRVTKKEKIKAKRQIEKVKIYGCSLPNEADKEVHSNADDSDDETANITFAPDDYEPFRFKGKDNYFGIGYSGLNRQNVLSSQTNAEPNYQSSNKSLPIFGHAFGVGVFEADDDDIYEKEDMSRYDSVLGPERKSKTRWSKNDNSNNKESNSVDGFVRAADKLNCRKVFPPPHLPKDYQAVHFVRKSRFYPPIPRESINEKKKILNAVDRARILSDVSVPDKIVQKQLKNATEKAPPYNIPVPALISEPSNSLGHQNLENSIDSEKPKVQTSTSWVDKLSAKQFVSGGVTGLEQVTPGLLNKSKDFSTSTLTKQTNQNSFSTDPDKQKRYERFLSFKTDERYKLKEIQPVTMTQLEKDQELLDFERAAKSIDPAESNVSDTNGSNNYTGNLTDCLEKQKEEAAKMEMFGKLTREIIEWQPASIVCKRFNVPEPKTNVAQIKTEKKQSFSVFNSLDFDTSSRFLKATDTTFKDTQVVASTLQIEEPIKNHASIVPTNSKTFTTNNEPQIVSEKVKNFAASYEKIFGKTVQDRLATFTETSEVLNTEPSVSDPEKSEGTKIVVASTKNSEEKKDLFRAIFLSSSEDSDSETEENIDNEAVKSVLIGDSSNEINTSRNMSPPRGIFAKLDLDDLVSKTPNVTDNIESNIKNKQANLPAQSEAQSTSEENDTNQITDALQTIPSDVYGPMLPSRLIKDGNTSTSSVGNTEFSKPIFKSVVVPKVADKLQGKWVESYKAKKSKKDKKKHKHKEHKSSKSKKKSKKHKH